MMSQYYTIRTNAIWRALPDVMGQLVAAAEEAAQLAGRGLDHNMAQGPAHHGSAARSVAISIRPCTRSASARTWRLPGQVSYPLPPKWRARLAQTATRS